MLHNRLKKDFWLMAVIFAAAFLLYGNTLRNGYSLDDTYVTQNNPRVEKGIAGIPEIFISRYVDEEGNSFGYRPVAVATFAIEYSLWGENPHLSHLVNILLYVISLWLLFSLLIKIFRGSHPLFLLAVVLLFAAHPIHTEVVASLKNRETLLSFLFGLCSLALFIKWFDTRQVKPAILGMVCFILAFLSKQDAVTFTAVIPLALFVHSGEPVPSWMAFPRKLKMGMVPIFLAVLSFIAFCYTSGRYKFWPSVISFVLTFLFLLFHYLKKWPERNRNGAGIITGLLLLAGAALSVTWFFLYIKSFAFLALACYTVFFLRLTEKPAFRNFNLKENKYRIVILVFMVALAGVLAYMLPNLYLPAEDKVVYNFENPLFANDPHYPTLPLAFYTLYFYISKLFFPHPLGFYYGYRMIPEVGWTTPVVILSLLFHVGILVFALWKLPKKHVLSFAILYYLAAISIFTNIVIKIPGIVGERLAFFPSLGFCLALAYAIFRLLQIDILCKTITPVKIRWVSAAILVILVPYSVKTVTRNNDWKDYFTLYSHDIGYLANSAKANNIYAGQLLKEALYNEVKKPSADERQQYLALAVKHFKRTLEIDSTFKFAWNNLGAVYSDYLGNREEALRCMLKAVSVDPDYDEAHYNLGYTYRQQKEYGRSIAHFREAQRISPGKMFYYAEEAESWFQAGNRDSALVIFKKASEMDPVSDIPLNRIGDIYWLAGDTLRAVETWERSFELNPANLIVCNNLMTYYAGRGNPKAAFYQSRSLELQRKKH